ncbi:16S rRNA (guanine(966)-N(2))-methyltransferase RsmD [Gryllotalpicola protaetiae]|uniref:16S rRNA (Guanine(966)-N(2))-methyltransferase RsmD n=1 Tax=Gryllotalpicola protaetiae TaxID=2419771 RepID=A0A387BE45_9MICO|nr:16S rRNA (guanine(966)-N(2))-methyltransferase RsmD [Gryllotalpicola protaetiae]AYG02163.1 16S rRNA (guanine(966)-N(2))-methyltransferase RsmD [Gryllotalpicola protaetiae]
MTRIIAGAAGRVTLRVPKAGTRPSSDRVREALFSALEARDALDGARVLDLYAGSGALGLEAASRGARFVVLVEKNPTAVRVAKANTALVTTAMRADASTVVVMQSAVASYLASAAGSFDLVFSDPPYDVSDADVAADLAAVAPLLAPEALVVVERSSRSPEPVWPKGLTPTKPKKYGETTIWFAERSDG